MTEKCSPRNTCAGFLPAGGWKCSSWKLVKGSSGGWLGCSAWNTCPKVDGMEGMFLVETCAGLLRREAGNVPRGTLVRLAEWMKCSSRNIFGNVSK